MNELREEPEDALHIAVRVWLIGNHYLEPLYELDEHTQTLGEA